LRKSGDEFVPRYKNEQPDRKIVPLKASFCLKMRREKKKNQRFVYGPVPSRRLGISLGVDVVPFKTCSYDCVYCQLGKTTHRSTERRSFVPIDTVIGQIKEVTEQNGDIDYITFSGSGEPTVNSDIGEIIRRIKGFTEISVAVLTNSSLLWKEEVREDLLRADLVVPSVDAVSEHVFRKINRPAEDLNARMILEGIREFCESFRGKVFVEIMLVKGLNDSEEEITKINKFVRQLRVDRIQLNTVVRPPSQRDAKALDAQELLKIKELFDKSVPVEIITNFDRISSKAYHRDLERAMIELLRRRPTKKADMALALGVHPNEIVKYLYALERRKKIKRLRMEGESDGYYLIA
jgi:wyosine [tRNA(Phe)-imidazoG37] synthetase (radical SAM superfamily)